LSCVADITETSAEGLALHTQVVLPEPFIHEKTTGSAQVARESVDHLKHYFRLLFSRKNPTQKRKLLMKVTVETLTKAPIDKVWSVYTSPDDIKQWNAASEDWHTTQASVDLREGGLFSSRMEAKDGSMGFDFAGTYTRILPNELIEYSLGDRDVAIEFISSGDVTTVRATFDAEGEQPVEQQRAGWQSILDNFTRYVEAKQ
jgi:uncharacterized protein YndB with AHSA1/START domain